VSGAVVGGQVALYESGSAISTAFAETGSGVAPPTASTLSEGVHSITARASDAAGNFSADSAALPVTIDLTAPAAPGTPDLQAASDTGTSNTDDETNDTTPSFDVASTPTGATISLSNGTGTIGTPAGGTGGTVTITPTLAGGSHTISAVATDTAGNSASSGGLAVTVDVTGPSAPSAPALDSSSDSGTSGDRITNDTTPTLNLSGAPANAPLTVFDGATQVATATADGIGNAQVTLSSALSNATHSITAKAGDAAGNLSSSSSVLSLKIDTVAPTVTITAPSTLTNAASFQFNEAMTGVNGTNTVLRLTGTTTDLAASVSYSSTTKKASLTPSSRLIPGQHYTLHASPSGSTAATDAAGNALAITASNFRAQRLQEESSVADVYGWKLGGNASAFGGTYVQARNSGDSASYSFTGTSVTWYTVAARDQGIAYVYVDNVFRGSFNNYSAATIWKLGRTIGGLSNSAHTIKVVVRGIKGSTAATGYGVIVDAFKVGTTTDVTPALTYAWQTINHASASGGRYARSDLGGMSVSMQFRGTGVDWITVLGRGEGKAYVYVDNVLKLVADNYSATTRFQYRRSIRGLSDGLHTIKIVVLGTRNASATASWISVDRFDVI
jgi:hypothetical protein